MKNVTETGKTVSEKTAVALGIFDGVHTGHRAVLDRAIGFGKSGLEPAVFTFNTESIRVKHEKKYSFIISNSEKLGIMKSIGVKYICCPDFLKLKEMSADDFAAGIIKNKLNAGVVVCGQRFRFGRDAECGAEQLIELGKKYGFDVSIVEPVIINGQVVSSTAIKELLHSGDIRSADLLLGYRYNINQNVMYGKQIGRTINFPTINQYFLPDQIIPRYGVYASETEINGANYLSITNIGIKPTVTDEKVPLAETHIFDCNADLYNKSIKVTLSDFIRAEKHFRSLDELKNAITADIKAVKALGGF